MADDPQVLALRRLCARNGGVRAVAEKIGANPQTLDQIIKGVKLPSGNPRGVGPDLRKRLSEEYPDWLGAALSDSPTAPASLIDLDDNQDYPAIRRVRFKLSAGASGFEVDYLANDDGAPIVFQRKWFKSRNLRPDKLFAVRVAGASMEPTLFDDDTVVVNTAQTEPRDGVAFAVNYEGELVIKRLVRDGGQWWLSSDNPDQRKFPRKVADEHSVIIGEIVHKQSERI